MSVVEGRGMDQGREMAWDLPTEVGLAPSRYFDWKCAVDVALASLLLMPGLPLIGLLAIAVRVTSHGPGLYRQWRVGKGGRRFRLLKIRTMVHDAEAVTGPVWTQPNDPRVTRLGRVLRRLHFDELPQLINVLRGDMSLVGPRPERPEFVRVLKSEIAGYVHRQMVRPGVTGLAQINLPPDTDLDSVRRKLVLDLDYIQKGSLSLDLRMLACTLIRMVGLPGDLAMLLFGLRREADLGKLQSWQLSPTANGTHGTNGSGGHPLTPASLFPIFHDPVAGDGKAKADGECHGPVRPKAATTAEPR